MKKLLDILKQADTDAFCLQDKVLILPFGGRIIGLHPSPDLNVLWVNSALDSSDSARAFLHDQDQAWINSGGERTWISPEVETNIGDPARMAETYDVPKSVDPGKYQVVSLGDNEATLESEINVPFLRTERTLRLKVTKTVSVIEHPPLTIPSDVAFAGYVVKSQLTAEDLPAGAAAALWHLIQVRGGGEIIVPVRQDARPRAFIGSPVFKNAGGLVTCDVQASASFKFSIRARNSLGLMIYLNTGAPQSFMIARRFAVSDESLYADVPCDDLSDSGYVQQVYVDDGAMGGFGELEYHTPALGRIEGALVCDESSTWAFAGAGETLETLCRQLIMTV